MDKPLDSALGRERAERIITLSFDDGWWADQLVMKVLDARGIPATFYLCAGYCDLYHLHVSPSAMPGLYAAHEVGCHSMTHPNMRNLPIGRAIVEISDARSILQSLFQQEVEGFAWPYGAVNLDLIPVLERSGFQWARGISPIRKETVWARAANGTFPPCGWPGGDRVHLISHSYKLVPGDGLGEFARMLDRFHAAGFRFVTNAEYYAEIPCTTSVS